MRSVMHRRQPHPIARPMLHVLVVSATKELYSSEGSLPDQLAGIEAVVGVDRCLHHHVILAALFLGGDDGLMSSSVVAMGTVQAQCLPRLEHFHCHATVRRDRRHQVDGVILIGSQDFPIIGMSPRYTMLVAELLQQR